MIVWVGNEKRGDGVGAPRDRDGEADTDPETDTDAAAEDVADLTEADVEPPHGTVLGALAAVAVWYVQMPPAFTLGE